MHVDVATGPSRNRCASRSWHRAKVYHFSIKGGTYFRDPIRGEIKRYQLFLKSGNWDAIFFHTYEWPLRLALPLLDSIHGKKVLISHGYRALRWIPNKRFPFGLGVFFSTFFQFCRIPFWVFKFDRWIFLSAKKDLGSFLDHWMAQALRHPGIRIIPNSIDPRKCGQGGVFRKKMGFARSDFVFLCVGYFSKGKNQILAVRSFLKAGLDNSRLVFIGPKQNEWYFQFKKAVRSDLLRRTNSQIIWLTRQTRKLTLDAFAGCNVVVSSSFLETQPFCLLEGMREAKPWIAVPAGCISDFEGGICVRGEKEMAAAMKLLASDSPLRLRLGRQGRRAIQQKYSLKKCAQAFLGLLQE